MDYLSTLKVIASTLVLSLTINSQLISQDDFKQAVMDAETRLQWHEQHLEMRDESRYKDLKWKHIGPTHMSGRVTDIAKPSDQEFTFYVATASGGLWRTRNEGTNWEPIFDDAPSASTGAVAVDPRDSKTIWVGLGEANIFRSSMSGTGVYKSTDEGETWQHMGLADSHHIARIIVHPTDSNIVYVAASGHEYTPNEERGIFKTTNGGITWKKVLYENDIVSAIDLTMAHESPDTLYASMWPRTRRPWSDPVPGEPFGGIFRSTDGGKTWTRLSEGLPAREKCGRTGIAVSRTRPNVVYALIDNHEVSRKAADGETDAYGRPRQDILKGAQVFRSDDHGDTWNQVSSDSRTMKRLFSTYGWVFGQIRVDPNDENTTYIMGVPLLKSTNGGKTYNSLMYPGLHGDHHAMWIDPENSNYIINGNDGGVNLSYDGGVTWKNLENLPVVQFYNVEIDNAKPFNVYGSIQDNNSWFGPSNHVPGRSPKSQWKRIAGGEASYMAIDPDDQNTFYSESFYGRLLRTNLSEGKTESIKPSADDEIETLRGQWLAPFTLSPHNSRIVYHGMQCVFRSLNRGDDWERISPDLTYNDPEKQGNISFATISTLSESPKKFGLLYVGTDDGRVHVTRDGGINWKQINEGIPKHTWVSRIVASQFDEGTVYLTLNGKRDNEFQIYVYRSSDYGDTWDDISEGIPGGPVNVILEDPFSEKILYVGTDLGVYVTDDSAESWSVLGSELPLTFVHDMKIHAKQKKMVIATHGRGMFTIAIRKIKRDNDDQEED